MLDQGCLIATVVRVNADAGGNEQFFTSDTVWLCQRAEQLVRHLLDVALVRHVGEHDHEFVATETRHRVAITCTVLEPACDQLQQLVANRVPERVVDDFESVQIAKQHSRKAVMPRCARDCLADAIDEQCASGQTSERVVVGLMDELRFGGFTRSFVAQIRRDAVGVRRDVCVEPGSAHGALPLEIRGNTLGYRGFQLIAKPHS